MTSPRSDSWSAIPWAAVASLLPWAAFLLASGSADIWVDDGLAGAELAAAAPFYLGFVALPSVLPLAAARAGAMRLVALIVMTVTAATAGLLVVSTDDAQAGLAVLWVPLVAIPLATVLWIGQAVAARRTIVRQLDGATAPVPAGASDRLAALVIDVALIAAVLIVPLTRMSHAKHEVAAGVLGVALASSILATLVAFWGRTVGQSILGLAVVDARSMGRVTFPRAFLRSFIVVVEVAAALTITLSPAALAELMSVSTTGRSLTDKVLRTSVVTGR